MIKSDRLFLSRKGLMTAAVRQLLTAFDSLSPAEKQEAAAEILRRAPALGSGDLPESALMEAADELFRALNIEESGGVRR
jgi:hypothetical protein